MGFADSISSYDIDDIPVNYRSTGSQVVGKDAQLLNQVQTPDNVRILVTFIDFVTEWTIILFILKSRQYRYTSIQPGLSGPKADRLRHRESIRFLVLANH